MYLSFYHLNEKPFSINSDPKFLWLGEKHKEALANLKYGLIETNGYVVLTGDVGTGKTTLVKALTETLDDNVLVATINHPTLNSLDFFKLIAKAYNLPAEVTSKADFLPLFSSFLQTSKERGKTVLLLIDEAHRLSVELLEEIRLLSNVEQGGAKLINIFFVGQNELKQVLATPECRALRQRITLIYEIEPLQENEVRPYMTHRLSIAGCETSMFTPDAIRRIRKFTKGYPRLTNILCDRALLTGFVKEQRKIDADIISESAKHIRFLFPKTSMILDNRLQDTLWSGKQLIRTSLDKIKFPENLKNHGNTNSYKWWLVGATGLFTLISIATGFTNSLRSPYNDSASLSKEEVASETRMPEHKGEAGKQQLTSEKIESSLHSQTAQNQDNDLVESSSLDKEISQVEQPSEESQAPLSTHPSDQPPSPLSDFSHSTSVVSAPDKLKVPAEQDIQINPRQPSKDIELKRETQISKDQEEVPAESVTSETKTATITIVESSSQEKQASLIPDRQGTLNSPQKTDSPMISLSSVNDALENDDFQLAIDLLEVDNIPDDSSSWPYREVYVKALVGRAKQLLGTLPDEAETLLLKSVEIDPNNFAAYLSLGKLYTRAQKYAVGIDAYQHAIRLNPELPKAFFNLGFIYATTRNYKDAEKSFTRVVELKPDYLDKALFNLALVQEKLGKNKECVENLKFAMTVNPGNEKVQGYLRELLDIAEVKQ